MVEPLKPTHCYWGKFSLSHRTPLLPPCMTIILLFHFPPHHITMFSSLPDYMSGVGRHNLLYFKVFPQAFAQENNNCVLGNEGQRTGGNLSSQLASPSGSQSGRHSVNVSPLKKYLVLLLCKLSKAGTESQFLHISEGIAHGSSSFRQGIKSGSVSLTPKEKPSHRHSLHLGQNRRGGRTMGKTSSQSPGNRDWIPNTLRKVKHKCMQSKSKPPTMAIMKQHWMELEVIGEIYKELVKARLQMTQPVTHISSLDFISGSFSGSLLATAVGTLHCMQTGCSETGQTQALPCSVALFYAKLKSGQVHLSSDEPLLLFAPIWSLHLQRLCMSLYPDNLLPLLFLELKLQSLQYLL